MASGLFALLDDIAAIAKVAAATLDDTAAQAVKVGGKAAAIVIDDAAVTPRYVVGFAADRELPIIAKIAWGSLKNKLLYLLPGALALSYFAPWAITPLLMAGGAFLCFEGYEKVHEMLHPPAATADITASAPATGVPTGDAKALEDAKVTSAIRTDFILSAEIMALSLASVTAPSFAGKAAVLGLVGVLVTVAVYGTVALIVKADDFGLHLSQKGRTRAVQAIGRGLVTGMPAFLKMLSVIGMLAMLWVGGGIILHGLEDFGLGFFPHLIHAAAKGIGAIFGPLSGLVTWMIDASVAGVIGLAIGWGVVKAMEKAGFGH